MFHLPSLKTQIPVALQSSIQVFKSSSNQAVLWSSEKLHFLFKGSKSQALPLSKYGLQNFLKSSLTHRSPGAVPRNIKSAVVTENRNQKKRLLHLYANHQ